MKLYHNNGNEIRVSVGRHVGVTARFIYRSYNTGKPYHAFIVFFFGTFLGLSPHFCRQYGRFSVGTASNGVALSVAL